MSRVFIGVGHGGQDTGAVGLITEKHPNLIMAKACRDYLIQRGVDVLMSRDIDENESLTSKINECNSYKPDLALDCHNNAGRGNGFEIYHSIFGGTGEKLAKNIEAEIIKIGQNSRGLKTKINENGNDYFGFIRETVAPAVICEGAFVDNPDDAKQIDTDEECKRFGEAYAKGILKTFGIEDGSGQNDNNVELPFRVKVTVDALNVREGAGANYKANSVIYDRGGYTIVDTKIVDNITWGKLKSGVGWIALLYTKKI